MKSPASMRLGRWVVSSLLLAAVGTLRAEVKIDPGLPADTAATVDGQAIPRSLVETFLKNDREALGLDPAKDADRARLADLPAAILDELVERTLILQETRRRGIEPKESQLDVEEKHLLDFCGSEARYAEYVAQNGFDRAGYRDHVLRPAVAGKALAAALTRDLDATDDEVRAYHEAHAADADFQQPARVAGEHILINARPGVLAARLEQSENLQPDTPAMAAAVARETTAARARADFIHDQAAAPGADFAALARKFSEDNGSREAGGSLGIFARGVHPAALDDAFFALKPGEISPVVQTEYGFHLLRITARYPAGPKTLAEATPEIRSRLRQQKSVRFLREWLSAARASAQIVVRGPRDLPGDR